MAAPEITVPHAGLADTTVGVVGGGPGSKVFHLDEVSPLESKHDGRTKRILLNAPVTGGKELLVDVVTVAAGSASPRHYHAGTDHFFFILDGRGRIEINGTEYPLRAGSVAWIADGDVHKVFADPDRPLTFLEYFSRGHHETVFIEQGCEWTHSRG